MTRKREKEAELTPEELEEQDGEELPDREAMSIIDPTHGPPFPTLPVEPPAEE